MKHAAQRAPNAAVENDLVALLVRVALVALAILPLVVGSIWIYGASAGAFRLQHQIRIAQNSRNDLMRLFLAMEGAVRGFAATGDPFFAEVYHRYHGAFTAAVGVQRDASDPAAAIFESMFGQSRPRDDVAILTMRV